MNEHANCNPKLDDVLAFNQTLIRLERAGIPIGVGDSETKLSLRSKIDSINSKVAVAVARGSSVRQILESNEELPAQYRSALSVWLFCDHSPEALAALSDQAGERCDMEKVLSFSLLQPMVIAGLVYLGFLYLVFGVSPKLESIATQIGAEPGVGLWFLQSAKSTAWIWAIAVPTCVALALAIWNRNKSRWSLEYMPGRRRIVDAIENANMAQGIRLLLENENSQEGTLQPNKATGLLKWALSERFSCEEKLRSLSASEITYQGIAKTRTEQMRAWFPTLVGASLGGLLVLIFGLSLFAPMIELLTILTRP
jgi:type II secretory pathway component PulF